MEEFSYAEIAEMLAIPVGTVMSRISRGRRMLFESTLPSPEARAPIRECHDCSSHRSARHAVRRRRARRRRSRRRVDQHLRACPPCRARVAAEQAVRALIAATQAALEARVRRQTARACASCARAPAATSRRRASGSRGRAWLARPLVTRGARVWRRSRSPPRLVLIVGGAFLYQADGAIDARAGRRTHRRPREVLRA